LIEQGLTSPPTQYRLYSHNSIITCSLKIQQSTVPSTQYNGECELHPNQAKCGNPGGIEVNYVTLHHTIMTNKRITNRPNKLLSFRFPLSSPWPVGYFSHSCQNNIIRSSPQFWSRFAIRFKVHKVWSADYQKNS